MPLRDGTGPMGMGPRTGRGRGMCGAWRRIDGIGRVRRRRASGLVWGLAIPVAAAAVRDLISPRGCLRQAIRALLPKSDPARPPRLGIEAKPLQIDTKKRET